MNQLYFIDVRHRIGGRISGNGNLKAGNDSSHQRDPR